MTGITHKLSYLIRAVSLAGSMIFTLTMSGQTPAWFPLEVGNTWLYRSTAAAANASVVAPQFRIISVHGKETIADREYFDVTYFGREVLLRVEPSDGSVIQYDRTSGSETNWVSPGAPVGSTFPTSINPCPTNGTVASTDNTVTTPAATFANAVEVKFLGNCVDVGVTQQFYVPYIGLVSDQETTIAGPVKVDLAYYHLGSATGAAPEVSFTLALDSPQYRPNTIIQARITLRSTSANPIPLHFPSGQSFDLKIRNEKGDVFYVWSTGRAFTQIIRDLTFGPGEMTFGVAAPLADLPPGRYTAEAYLTTDPVMYLADVSFEVVSYENP